MDSLLSFNFTKHKFEETDMEIIYTIIVLVIILGAVLIYGAVEFGLNKTECTLVAIGGIALAILSFWW